MTDPLLLLHDLLREREAASRGYTAMSPEEKAAYHREANRAARAKAAAAKASGDLEPTPVVVRTLLADAALIILATGGPGSSEIRSVLTRAFPTKAGVPMTVETQARTGRLKPKLARV